MLQLMDPETNELKVETLLVVNDNLDLQKLIDLEAYIIIENSEGKKEYVDNRTKH